VPGETVRVDYRQDLPVADTLKQFDGRLSQFVEITALRKSRNSLSTSRSPKIGLWG
jgi:hypothetical protein